MLVLIAQADEPLAEEQARQLRMDGHHVAVALSARATGLRLRSCPTRSCSAGSTARLRRSRCCAPLRAGEIARSDHV